MRKIATKAFGALIGISVIAASMSTPAQADQRDRRIAAGIIAGAIGGAIIANHINKKRAKKRYRKRAHARRHWKKNRRWQRRKYRQRLRRQHRRNYRAQPHYWNDRYDYSGNQYYSDRSFEYEPRYRSQNRESRKLSRLEKHIQRCKKAYRSYDPRSDTYLGYDGREHVCRK